MSQDWVARLEAIIADQEEVVRQIEKELTDAEGYLNKVSLKLDLLTEHGAGIPDLGPELRSLEGEVALFEAQVRGATQRLETQRAILQTLQGVLKQQWR